MWWQNLTAIKVNSSVTIPQLTFDKGLTYVNGPNGIGKSTLVGYLKSLPVAKNSSFADQSPLDFFHPLKVIDILYVAAKQSQNFLKTKKTMESLVRDFCLNDGLWSYELSGGQGQMLKLILTMGVEKQNYIFDEPSQGLAEDKISVLSQCLKKLLEQDCNILVIEHDQRLSSLLPGKTIYWEHEHI